MEIQIKTRRIGINYKPLVIAELGINHEGSLSVAFQMVDAAHQAGAEIIKHQTHIIDEEMSPYAKKLIPGNTNVSIYEVMERCALSEDDEVKLKNYVESKGMIFISTPFSKAAADRLKRMNVPAYKIGSGEMNNFPLLDYIASFGKPMIVSTGMNDLETVKKAVNILEKRNIQYALLHTTNIYPTSPNLVRLGAMQELQKEFPNTVIGLSDHTIHNYASFAAVALGASIVERHFTDRSDRPGPDIVCSMTPSDLKDLILGTTDIWKMRGGKKIAAIEEKVTSNFAFSTVVTIKKIKKGDVFSAENIWVKRPGTGEIIAEKFNSVLGKVATRDINSDEHLKFGDIE
jgi:N-acetylneuraminate synthase